MGKTKLIVLLVAAAIAITALAPPASAAKEPVNYVLGTVRLDSGFYAYTKVYPMSVVGDQFFSYWVGMSDDNQQVIYDPLGQIWYQAPVQYQRTAITFRGMPLDGFVRMWGRTIPYIDGTYFFGVDGMTYKLVKKYKRVGPYGNRHRRLKSSYYLNLTTGEQSNWAPRTEEELAYYKSLLPGANAQGGEAFPEWAEGQADPAEPPASTAPMESLPGDEEEVPTPSEVVEQATGTGEGSASGDGSGTGEGKPAEDNDGK